MKPAGCPFKRPRPAHCEFTTHTKNAAMFRQLCCAPLSRKPPLPRILIAAGHVARRYSSRYPTTSPRTRSSRTSSRSSMDFKLKAEQRKGLGTRNPRSIWTPASRRSSTIPQRADRSSSRRREGTPAGRWMSSTSPTSRPVTASRSTALRHRAGQDRSQQAAPPHGAELATEQHTQ